MGRWRRKLGVVLGVLSAVVFVACVLIQNFAKAADAVKLYGVYDRPYRKTSGGFDMPEYFLGADVVLEQKKINLYQACANYNNDTKHGADDSRYGVTINNNPTGTNKLRCLHHEKGNNTTTNDGHRVFGDVNTYSIGIEPGHIKNTKTSYPLSGVSIDIVSQDAAHDRFDKNKTYDLVFHITDINIRSGTVNDVEVKKKKKNGKWVITRNDKDTGIALLYGFTSGNTSFGAQTYYLHQHLAVGVKYNISLELIDHNATNEAERKPKKSMVWMLADIDIGQKLNDEDDDTEPERLRHTYYEDSTYYPYAEHVKIISGGMRIEEDERLKAQNDAVWHQDEKMVPVAMVPGRGSTYVNGVLTKAVVPGELGIAPDGGIYHRYLKNSSKTYVPSKKYSGNVTDNSTDAAIKFKINDPNDPFKIEWGGSGCGTLIANAPYEDEKPDFHYNYELKPYVTNDSSRAAYLGSKVTMDPGVAIIVRKDTEIDDPEMDTYATMTKETEVKYSYYFTDSAGHLKGGIQEARETELRRFNDENDRDSRLDESEDEPLDSITIDIGENYAVGDRVCVELSVYPFESHDGTNNLAVARKETSDISTRRATTSCLPIAKRPIISIESSNVYSATNIYTLTYGRNINGVRYTFGSWSEYGVFGRVHSSTMMASGAALGYSRDGYTGGKNLNVARENPGEGNKVSTTNNSNDCTFMTQTFANAECKQDENASPIGDITADQFRERMIERYKDNSSMALVGVTQKQFGGVQYSDVSNIDPTINAFYNSKTGFASVKAGNLYLSKTPSFASDDREHNHTIVYQATNLIIDGDLNKELTKSMISPYDTTGVVILADRVYLTDRATYVNATIIADEVNTCAFQAANPSQKLKMSNLNSNICNSSVIFDQPVVTKRLILNRTAGANSGTGSIVRAEVFNLNFGNYLWSYSQMARYSQAVTSFAREISPRY